MKKVYSFVFCLIVFVFYVNTIRATHMIGGEVSYSCLGSNTFRVSVTLFQNCFSESAVLADYPFQFAIYENSPSRPMVHASVVRSDDIDVEEIPHGFTNECIRDIPEICFLRSSGYRDVVLPPSIYGYTIVYQRCCRNAGIQNIMESGNFGVTYEAVIPPFEDGECPNNSAEFNQMPPQIICSDYPFMYSYAATDIDGDSLSYRLCESYVGASMSNPIPKENAITPPPFSSVPYVMGMSFDNPITATPPASINPVSGLLTVTPSASGRFQVKVCIDEYRNGVLINTHSRDLQFVITSCVKLVSANIPLKSEEPNTYMVVCSDYTVAFEETSAGAVTYHWDFGDGSAESDVKTPVHTYSDTGVYEVKLTINRGTQCADSIVRLVKVYPYFEGDFNFEGVACPGEPFQFYDSLVSSYKNIFDVFWDFGDGHTAEGSNPIHIYDSGGVYTVKMYAKSDMGCEVFVSINRLVN